MRLGGWLALWMWATPAFAGEEIRESYDGLGHPIRRLVLQDDSLVEEQVFKFDGDKMVERTTTRGTEVTVERWAVGPAGEAIFELQKNGAFQSRETTYSEKGKVVRQVLEVANEPAKTTTWSYDAKGNVIASEVQLSDGTVVSRTVADRAPAPRTKVPLTLAVDAGVAYNSTVDAMDMAVGFSVARKPTSEQYAHDPLEVRSSVMYRLGRSKGEKTNDDLVANFGLDYNQLVKHLTVFLFTNLNRNPTAHLNADLIVAPIGVKYDFLEGDTWKLDASFAPVWNFRSVVVQPGAACEGGAVVDSETPCDTSKFRGSFRVRAGYSSSRVKVSDVVEWLPNLVPADGYPKGLGTDSVFRNTAGLEVALSQRLSLKESFVFTRDPTLAAQADCSADPNNLLCDGLSFVTTTTLSFKWDVGS